MTETFLDYQVYPRLYRDSVNLMALAAGLEDEPGIVQVGAVMGTPANLDVLARSDMLPPSWDVKPDDLCIVVRGTSTVAVTNAIERADEILTAEPTQFESGDLTHEPRTVREALRDGDADLVAISVPGEFAGAVAENALKRGLHVFCFSDNVPQSTENHLKTLAAEKGLLMMGPDCGTALIDGTPLGFVNDLPAGPVGLIAASGTGAQELSTLLASAEIGTSQIVGVGGHDLMGSVTYPASFVALDRLSEDPQTEVIVVVSKPPAEHVAAQLVERLRKSGKPAFACLLGQCEEDGDVPVDGTIEGAGARVAAYFGKTLPAEEPPLPDTAGRTRLLGLYTGGTLASEAQVICDRAGVPAQILDLGDDEHTQGRPHPMIAPENRAHMLEDEDVDSAIILMDFVLGWGATADPASPVAQTVSALREAGKKPLVFASITGTDRDHQGYDAQGAILRDAGIVVFPSNAAAVRAAVAELGGKGN